MSHDLKPVSRAQIAARSLLCACPNCGKHGLHRNWIKLNENCRSCSLPLKMDEGFYSATTSIGYVLLIIVVILPLVILAVLGFLTEVQAIVIGAASSILLTALLYPAMLSWVLGSYYVWFPSQLPANGGKFIQNETR